MIFGTPFLATSLGVALTTLTNYSFVIPWQQKKNKIIWNVTLNVETDMFLIFENILVNIIFLNNSKKKNFFREVRRHLYVFLFSFLEINLCIKI